MSAVSWLLWVVLTAALLFGSLWHYRRRETPGRGRAILAVLRAASVSLVLLLLFDPELPARDGGAGRGAHILLDASLSMSVPGESGAPLWQEAVRVAQSRSGERPVLLFGDRARAVPPAELPDSVPGDSGSRLLPALQAAAEAGAGEVVVISDGAIEDADAVARWLPRLGLRVELVTLPASGARNRAVVEASAPAWIDPSQPATIAFGVAGTGQDSVRAVVRRDGRVLARATLPPPARGRVAAGSVDVRLEPPPGGGWVRLDVALEPGDSLPDDDARTVYVQVGDEPAGVVLVSFRPDWEPRFLAPVLTNALGLPLRAWLRSATGQYLRLGTALDAGRGAGEEEIRRALERAQLVVLHGLGTDAPAWAHAAARTARHLLVFPADQSPDLPVPLGGELSGDFFPAAPIPASPVAALLTQLETAAATPLTSVRQAEPPPGAWVPLNATRGRQGPALPLIIAGQQDGRRWAVSLGSGYWVWAFRGDAERQLYTRLWSAVGGWLAQERSIAALPPVRPALMASPRGTRLPWIAPGVAADSLRITITDQAGATVSDTTLHAGGAETMYSAAPVPGHYRYRATAFADGNVLDAEGYFTIERYSAEFARPVADAGLFATPAATVRGGQGATRGRPLHSTAFPYVLLVTLLAAEWILRRRWGLR